MEPVGIALISPRMKHRDRVYLGGIDMYEGKILSVIEQDTCGFGDVHHEDILCFIPPIKKSGVIIPSGLPFIEEMKWMSLAHYHGIDDFNSKYTYACISKQDVIKNYDELMKLLN